MDTSSPAGMFTNNSLPIMRTSIGCLLAAAVSATCHATSVGLGTIEQPVNLCAGSDPSRIPLGRVATESNYHYGRGPVITAARPSLHGAMEWKSGTELDQNLAHVFGIGLNNHDVPHSPATILLKSRPAPPYSPYSKEQVLAATIHCLLRSNRGTPKQPIQLHVTAESPDDQALATKFSGEYINAPDRHDDPPVESTPVPDTRLETDSRGITWVVFPNIKPPAKTTARPPVFIPFRLGGENGPDDPLWLLLPVWTGSDHNREQSLETIGRPYPLFYDCFNPSTGGGPESNALFSGDPHGSVFSFDVTSTDAGTEALIRYPNTSTGTLAASVLALVLSAQPTAEHPLAVTLETGPDNPPQWLGEFRTCPGWTADDTAAGNRITLTCSFVWDPRSSALTKGAVPAARIVRSESGELVIEANSTPPEKPDPSLPAGN